MVAAAPHTVASICGVKTRVYCARGLTVSAVSVAALAVPSNGLRADIISAASARAGAPRTFQSDVKLYGILDQMEAGPTKSAAELALVCLHDLRHVEPSKALPNLRLIREFLGQIQPADPVERSTAWWELCQLCRELSGEPRNANAILRWEAAIMATEKWCARLE